MKALGVMRSCLSGKSLFQVGLVLAACLLVLAAQAASTNQPPGAIVLFDGQDTTQWTSGNGAAPTWNVTNGVLTIVPGSGSIRTWQTFEDFQLHLEFRFLSNSPSSTAENALPNSGVFLQDQFEIQILNSYNRPLSGLNDAGAVWSIRDANTNASLPGGMWESFDVTFRAARWTNGTKIENARVTLVWNGALAHDDVEIPRPTAGGAPPETPPPASIGLQDLVGTVQFRNIWLLPLEAARPPGPESLTLVAAGSSWRYLDDGSDQGTAWRWPDFDDSSWATGVAQFGYGDNDEQTVIRSNRLNGTRIQTTYFRTPFVVTNAWALTNVILGVVRDDGAVGYLNGTEVYRSNMDTGVVTSTTWAVSAVNNADETRFSARSIAPRLLVEGTNWLAFEVHQQSATSSDLSFDLRLSALAWHPPALQVARANEETKLSWPAMPPGFALQSAPTLSPETPWNTESHPALSSSNGWNSLLLKTDAPTRYYRLQRTP